MNLNTRLPYHKILLIRVLTFIFYILLRHPLIFLKS